MGGFLLRKIGAALIVLILSSMLVFGGVRAIPGDPAIAMGAENRDPAVLQAVRHKYLLDKPLPVQYVHWISLAVRGGLGVDQSELPVGHTILTIDHFAAECGAHALQKPRGPARRAAATVRSARRYLQRPRDARGRLPLTRSGSRESGHDGCKLIDGPIEDGHVREAPALAPLSQRLHEMIDRTE